MGITDLQNTLLWISRSFSPSQKLLISQQALKLDRRKRFSNRVTAAVFKFAATVISFLLSSLNIGVTAAGFIAYIRKSLMIFLTIDYPLSEKPELVNNALQNVNILSTYKLLGLGV